MMITDEGWHFSMCVELKMSAEQASMHKQLQHMISHLMAWQAADQILDSRILHLPMAFDDEWTRECISTYMRSARQDAPYLPSNIDFVAKNNGESHAFAYQSADARPCASVWLRCFECKNVLRLAQLIRVLSAK